MNGCLALCRGSSHGILLCLDVETLGAMKLVSSNYYNALVDGFGC